ncbi:hypothetical protein SAMN06265377_3554 [Flagellimonas pacifica]|uniref:Uncharacterized protein n=1 Tax=Flagellimonas pacifica TaxID=1247520 RepID=A0A285MWZ8_9FLAO|nr:hypothetical protein SAMN06265377_3554 [Allomuricauda parva]
MEKAFGTVNNHIWNLCACFEHARLKSLVFYPHQISGNTANP